MDDEESKELARVFLEFAGYRVEDIPPVPDRKSADLFATCPDGNKPDLIVEAKEKEPDKTLGRIRNEQLLAGQIHEMHDVLVEQSVLNRIVSNSVAQLRATKDRYPDALNLLFIVCTGFSAESRFEQFKCRVAGSTTVVDFSENGEARPCAFIRDSDFFKYRDILDAVILAKDFGNDEGFEAGFYVNCYSPRYVSLRDCENLQQILGEGFVDIAERDRAGECWSLHDVPGDRSNEQEMLKALRTKYGLSDKTMIMDMRHAGVEMLVPRPAN